MVSPNDDMPRGSTADPYRVMVVDDSAVVRGLITRMIEGDPDCKVVGSVGNGQLAVTHLDRNDVEVVVLDIEMPVMDGLTALPKLLAIDPDLKVIMASTLTLHNADISLRALELGAADYVPKPTSSREIGGGQDFQRELLGKIKALGANRRRGAPKARPGVARPVTGRPAAAPAAPKPLFAAPIKLRPAGTAKPDILAIGSSTGGPQALFTLLKGLKGGVNLPIVITQHMPATFTTILAEHITRMTGWSCAEAKDGDLIRSGQIFVAPGDFHMRVEQKGADRVLRLSKDPPENFCRPAVDPMFRSVAKVYGSHCLAVILTGMGQDGMLGGKTIVEAGGTVVAQDEATSVVWGMPGAAATAGVCSAVLPLPELPAHIIKFAARIGR